MEGIYKAKLVGAASGLKKDGDPYYLLKFQFQDNEGKTKHVNYMDSATPGRMPYFLHNLRMCGYLFRTEFFEDIALGLEGFDLTADFDITVQAQKNQDGSARVDDKGKQQYEVSFINGKEAVLKDAITPEQLAEKNKSKAYLVNDLAAYKMKHGIPVTGIEKKKSSPQETATNTANPNSKSAQVNQAAQAADEQAASEIPF